MDNRIKFTKEQLQNAINSHLLENGNINEVFEMVVNGLMLSERSEFLASNDTENNKGNGYRKRLNPGLGGSLNLSIPRDRLGVFKPIILGVLDQQEEKIKELSFALYSKGLTTRQIKGVLKDIYGTSYSKSGISRISKEFYEVVHSWQNRPLENYYPVIFIDAIHVKIRRDVVANEAFYVVLGLKEDFTREVLAIINLPTESASGWQTALEGLKLRGVTEVGLFVFDNLKGLDGSIARVYKEAKQQKCILHFQRNLSKNIRVKDREAFCSQVKEVFNPDDQKYTKQEAVSSLVKVLQSWEKRYPSLKQTTIRDDLELLFTYLNYDYRVRRMIYTTNWIERLNKTFRRTLKIRNALPTEEAAIVLMGSVAMEISESTYKYPITTFKFDKQLNNE